MGGHGFVQLAEPSNGPRRQPDATDGAHPLRYFALTRAGRVAYMQNNVSSQRSRRDVLTDPLAQVRSTARSAMSALFLPFDQAALYNIVAELLAGETIGWLRQRRRAKQSYVSQVA